MFAVTRSYTGASALIDALEKRHGEIERLISTVPGFVSYYAFRSGDTMTSVTICDDRAGVDETTRRAAEWVRENLADARMAPPVVNGGDVFVEFSASSVTPGAQRGSTRPRS